MHYLIILPLVLFLSFTHSNDDEHIKNPVQYFIGGYGDTTDIIDLSSREIVKIVSDFNDDNLTDILLADPYIGGAQNYEWWIFLQNSDGDYSLVGTIWFEDVAVKPISKGISKIIAYEHYSAEEGGFSEYQFSLDGITLIKSWPSGSDSSLSSDELFWRNGMLPRSYCSLRDLLKNINGQWHER